MKIFVRILAGLLMFAALILLLFFFDVMWKSPPHYQVDQYEKLKEPIMDMDEYETIRRAHQRPYIYSVQSTTGGSVHVLGLEHRKDPSHPQFDTLKTVWNSTKPNVAMIEGRLGFFFSWFMNPIKEYGVSGLTTQLAKKDKAQLFTWEPSRQDEIKILLNNYPAKQIAMFYTFRPYFGNMRHGKPEDPEKTLQQYLESRTDYDKIRNTYTSWVELDSVWQRDFPDIEWRNYSDEQGWPEGYLHEIWNSSNLARDRHLIQSVTKLVKEGKKVFVTMGSSHAPRIENTIRGNN